METVIVGEQGFEIRESGYSSKVDGPVAEVFQIGSSGHPIKRILDNAVAGGATFEEKAEEGFALLSFSEVEGKLLLSNEPEMHEGQPAIFVLAVATPVTSADSVDLLNWS